MSITRIMMIAGEASGDMHGAKLAEAIHRRAPHAFLFGIGGRAMQSEDVALLVDCRTLSVVGITEVVSKLPTVHRAMALVKKALRRIKPDLLVLIDFPDFNFRVAKAARQLKIPVLYYISPQIWAWRQNRVKTLKRLVDHMAVILPFEAPFYRRHRVPVTFVGHPLLDRIAPTTGEASKEKIPPHPTIGLLPGSRDKEVSSLLPVMLAAATRIRGLCPEAGFIVSNAPSVQEHLVSQLVQRHASDTPIEIVDGPADHVFRRSDLLVAASGTVTLEAALHGLPMVIVYKVSPLSYWLGKRLIKVKHIGIVNLIVQKALLPELIQDDASPQGIANEVIGLIEDRVRYRQMRSELLRVRELLGGSGASDRVADIALRLVSSPG